MRGMVEMLFLIPMNISSMEIVTSHSIDWFLNDRDLRHDRVEGIL